MKMKTIIGTLALSLAFTITPTLAQSGLAAALACEPEEARLAYLCTIHITDQASGDAVDGLAIQVKADMPSMPLAHNIPPVRARTTNDAGVYEFPITLDMYGRWAFSMTIAGPRQDMLVEILNFAAPEGEEDNHDHHHHDHDHHDSDDDHASH